MAPDRTGKQIHTGRCAYDGFDRLVGSDRYTAGRSPRVSTVLGQQRTFELMRLTALIRDLQPDRPFSRDVHFGRSKEKVLRNDADGLFGRVTGHRREPEYPDEASQGDSLKFRRS
jgi:hypothetical protein